MADKQLVKSAFDLVSELTSSWINKILFFAVACSVVGLWKYIHRYQSEQRRRMACTAILRFSFIFSVVWGLGSCVYHYHLQGSADYYFAVVAVIIPVICIIWYLLFTSRETGQGSSSLDHEHPSVEQTDAGEVSGQDLNDATLSSHQKDSASERGQASNGVRRRQIHVSNEVKMSDPEWETHLQPLFTELTNGLRVSGALLDLLQQKRLLTFEERSIVDKVQPNTEEEKVRCLIGLLKTKPSGTFLKFCSVLEDPKIGHNRLAERMRSRSGEED